MLFRCIAYVNGSPSDWPDMHVFFEADDYELARSGLPTLLEKVYGPDVEFYNLWSETEMLFQAIGNASTRDLRLLESGYAFNHPIYCDPLRTALLVTPPMHARLMKALLSLPPLSASGFPVTVPAKPVAPRVGAVA